MNPREQLNQIEVPEIPFPPRRPGVEIQLPTDASVLYVTPYRVEGKRYPKWKFWRNEKIKYNLAVLVEGGRLFIVDPDALTVWEKNND